MLARILRGKVVNSLARSRRALAAVLARQRRRLNASTFAAMMAATWLNQVCFARDICVQAYPCCRKGSNDQATDRDTRDTAVAFLAATLTLRGAGVVLTPRHNPLVLPEGVSRVAVAHLESDRAEPPVLNGEQLRRFVELLAAVSDEVPHRVLQVDYEAVASQRSFFIDAIAALRQRRDLGHGARVLVPQRKLDRPARG
jgi:hypothetical protein